MAPKIRTEPSGLTTTVEDCDGGYDAAVRFESITYGRQPLLHPHAP